MQQPTKSGGARFYVTFIDDFSRYTKVYSIRSKEEVLDVFMIYKTDIERLADSKIRAVRSDNGSEYMNKRFQKYLLENQIGHETSTAYCSQQNGLAERANRTLAETVRTLLIGANLPERLWGEAISTAAFLRNLIPKASIGNVTPESLIGASLTDYNYIKAFGSTAFVLKKKADMSKFGARSTKMVLVGFEPRKKAYRCYDVNSDKVFISRDVLFDETCIMSNTTRLARKFSLDSRTVTTWLRRGSAFVRRMSRKQW